MQGYPLNYWKKPKPSIFIFGMACWLFNHRGSCSWDCTVALPCHWLKTVNKHYLLCWKLLLTSSMHSVLMFYPWTLDCLHPINSAVPLQLQWTPLSQIQCCHLPPPVMEQNRLNSENKYTISSHTISFLCFMFDSLLFHTE